MMGHRCLVVDACQFTANYNYCLLEALAEEGVDVTYATTEYAHGYVPDPHGVKILRCFFLLARLAGRITSSGQVRRALRALEYPFDLCVMIVCIFLLRIRTVHLMWAVSLWLDRWLVQFLRLIGRRVVYTAHNPFPHEMRKGDIEKYARLYRCVDSIIALTEYTKNEIVDKCRIDPEKISIAPHGDYESLFRRYGCNDDLAEKVRQKARGRRIVAFLGAIRPYKGIDLFIESFDLIKRQVPEAFFLVAGSVTIGDKEALTEKLARSCDPDDLWADIRFLSVEDLKAYLEVVDLLVQPYLSGASQSGNTAMAYAHGIPVVSTDVGGLGEMTEDGKTGYVVQPGNPLAIAESVAKCLHVDNYRILSENARRAATEQYGWSTIAAQTAAVYWQDDPDVCT